MVYADDLAEDLVPLLSPVPNRVRVDGIFNAVQGRTLKAPVQVTDDERVGGNEERIEEYS